MKNLLATKTEIQTGDLPSVVLERWPLDHDAPHISLFVWINTNVISNIFVINGLHNVPLLISAFVYLFIFLRLYVLNI